MVLPISACGLSHRCLVFPTTIWSFPMSVKNINGPSHKCMWPFLSLLGLSHYRLVFPYECKKYQWSFSHHHLVFPTTIWSFPMSVKNINGPSHKCMWAFPITIWSFPMSAKSANGPSHQFIWVFPYKHKKYQWSDFPSPSGLSL